MSRSYLIRVPVSLVISDEDFAKKGHVKMGFDLMSILSPERMQELLGKVLQKGGWQEKDGVMELARPGNVVWRVSPDKHQIEIDISNGMQKEVLVSVPEEWQRDDARVESLLKDQLSYLDRETRETLSRELLQARKALNEALKDTYRESIKEKAQSLGNVTSIAESSESGTYRIRLEVQ